MTIEQVKQELESMYGFYVASVPKERIGDLISKIDAGIKKQAQEDAKIKPEDFTRVDNDTNGNPRYVCHFLRLCVASDNDDISDKYAKALSRSRSLGGRKFHNKQFGGGIVFQSYNLDRLCEQINDLLGTIDKYYQPELTDDVLQKIHSFEVYESKENAEKDFPGVKILEYSGNDIEEPTYVDR